MYIHIYVYTYICICNMHIYMYMYLYMYMYIHIYRQCKHLYTHTHTHTHTHTRAQTHTHTHTHTWLAVRPLLLRKNASAQRLWACECQGVQNGASSGTQFTCCNSTNVQILTPEELLQTAGCRDGTMSLLACSMVAKVFERIANDGKEIPVFQYGPMWRGPTSDQFLQRLSTDAPANVRLVKVLSLLALIVQKYIYWRRLWCTSTSTDAEAVSGEHSGCVWSWFQRARVQCWHDSASRAPESPWQQWSRL